MGKLTIFESEKVEHVLFLHYCSNSFSSSGSVGNLNKFDSKNTSNFEQGLYLLSGNNFVKT